MQHLPELHERWTAAILDHPKIAPLLATSAEQRAAVGVLRYRMFIERDGKRYAFADHDNRTFLEPIDELSLNFCVIRQNECLAAVRLTRATDASIDPQLATLVQHAELTDAELQTTAVNSRMVVAESGQARILIPHLFRQIYRAGLGAGITVCLACSRPSGVSLFERFGFLPVGTFDDPIAGKLVALRLNALDVPHLRAVRSPCLDIYEELFEQRALPEVEVA